MFHDRYWKSFQIKRYQVRFSQVDLRCTGTRRVIVALSAGTRSTRTLY